MKLAFALYLNHKMLTASINSTKYSTFLYNKQLFYRYFSTKKVYWQELPQVDLNYNQLLHGSFKSNTHFFNRSLMSRPDFK